MNTKRSYEPLISWALEVATVIGLLTALRLYFAPM